MNAHCDVDTFLASPQAAGGAATAAATTTAAAKRKRQGDDLEEEAQRAARDFLTAFAGLPLAVPSSQGVSEPEGGAAQGGVVAQAAALLAQLEESAATNPALQRMLQAVC